MAQATAPARRRTGGLPPAYLLIAPSVVFMALLFGWPMISGVLQAVMGPDGFTGAYLQRMTDDPAF